MNCYNNLTATTDISMVYLLNLWSANRKKTAAVVLNGKRCGDVPCHFWCKVGKYADPRYLIYVLCRLRLLKELYWTLLEMCSSIFYPASFRSAAVCRTVFHNEWPHHYFNVYLNTGASNSEWIFESDQVRWWFIQSRCYLSHSQQIALKLLTAPLNPITD